MLNKERSWTGNLFRSNEVHIACFFHKDGPWFARIFSQGAWCLSKKAHLCIEASSVS